MTRTMRTRALSCVSAGDGLSRSDESNDDLGYLAEGDWRRDDYVYELSQASCAAVKT